MRRRFAEEYVRDFHGAAAAVRAGYSAKTAKEIAYGISKDPKVQAYIAHLQEERAERLELSIDDVLRELWRIAMTNMGSIAEWKNGKLTLKDSAELSPAALASIAEVSERWADDGSRTLRVKQHGKAEILKTLLVYLDSRRGRADVQTPEELLAALQEHYGMVDMQPPIRVEALPAPSDSKKSNGHSGEDP